MLITTFFGYFLEFFVRRTPLICKMQRPRPAPTPPPSLTMPASSKCVSLGESGLLTDYIEGVYWNGSTDGDILVPFPACLVSFLSHVKWRTALISIWMVNVSACVSRPVWKGNDLTQWGSTGHLFPFFKAHLKTEFNFEVILPRCLVLVRVRNVSIVVKRNAFLDVRDSLKGVRA